MLNIHLAPEPWITHCLKRKKADRSPPFQKRVVVVLSLQFLAEIQDAWSCNEDGTVRTNDDTDHQGKNESFDVVATQQEDGQQHDKGREGGVDGTAESAIQSIVHDRLIVPLASVQTNVFTDAVKYDHRIVDGVSDNRQNRRNERLVDFHGER